MAEKTLPRVLLVDDEVNVLEGLRRSLRPFFDVTLANGAQEALNLVATQGPFEVIVSDMRMPGMDGITLLASIRRLFPNTVRVLLTGYGDMNSIIAAVNEGNVFRFLSKPCPPWALTRALEDSVRLYRQTTEASSTLAQP
jgi:DNA-binding NtrC family response regulator